MTDIAQDSVDIATPAKEMNNEEKQTGLKEHQIGQSHLDQSQQPDYVKNMDQLSKQILERQSRLKELSYQQKRLQDILSDDFLRLHQEKKEIKIQLINLKYIHLVNNVRYRKQLKRRDEQEEARLIAQEKQIKEKREQLFQQQLKKIQQQKKERRQKWEKQYQQRKERIAKEYQERKAKLNSLKQQDKSKQPLKQQEQQEIKKKTELRISEIQTQLLAARLRRSRMVDLEAELISLRSLQYSYWWDYPYWGTYYSRYFWPSRYSYSWLI